MKLRYKLPRWLWPSRLRNQITLSAGLMLMLTTGVLTGYLTAQQIDDELEKSTGQAQALASNLAATISTPLLTGNYTQTEEILSLASKFPNILSITVTEAQGQQQLSATIDAEDEPQIQYGGSVLTVPESITTAMDISREKLTLWQPVKGGVLVGWLRIDYDLLPLRASQAETLRQGILISALAIVFNTILLLFILTGPMHAISIAANFARKLNQVRGETFETERSSLELEQLGDSLNEASLSLSQQELALIASNEELRNGEARFRAVTDTANEAIVTSDAQGRIVYMNPAAERIFGYTMTEAKDQLLTLFIPEKHHDAYLATFQELKSEATDTTGKTFELEGLRKDGTEFPLDISVACWNVTNAFFCTSVMRDITESKRAEAMIIELSLIDELTGLHNRRGFFTLAEPLLLLNHRAQQGLLLLYADMNDFKHINDNLGHTEGDRALQDVANIMREVFRETDIISRIGGDEFAVIACEHNSESQQQTITRLQNALEQFNQSMVRPYTLSMSIGAVFQEPGSSDSLDDIVAKADAEMYLIKQARRATESSSSLGLRPKLS